MRKLAKLDSVDQKEIETMFEEEKTKNFSDQDLLHGKRHEASRPSAENKEKLWKSYVSGTNWN